MFSLVTLSCLTWCQALCQYILGFISSRDLAMAFGAQVSSLSKNESINNLLQAGRRSKTAKTKTLAIWATKELRKLQPVSWVSVPHPIAAEFDLALRHGLSPCLWLQVASRYVRTCARVNRGCVRMSDWLRECLFNTETLYILLSQTPSTETLPQVVWSLLYTYLLHCCSCTIGWKCLLTLTPGHADW